MHLDRYPIKCLGPRHGRLGTIPLYLSNSEAITVRDKIMSCIVPYVSCARSDARSENRAHIRVPGTGKGHRQPLLALFVKHTSRLGGEAKYKFVESPKQSPNITVWLRLEFRVRVFSSHFFAKQMLCISTGTRPNVSDQAVGD